MEAKVVDYLIFEEDIWVMHITAAQLPQLYKEFGGLKTKKQKFMGERGRPPEKEEIILFE